jgi:hypothetical protein
MTMSQNSFKRMTDFFMAVGANDVSHSEKTYLAHAIGVHNDLKEWGCSEDVCRGGMFHSIYGTQKFQSFTLPLERRPELRELIGERPERLAYLNCMMDRDSFDRAAKQADGPYRIIQRVTKEVIDVSPQDFDDLCTIHLCDWVEQVGRSQQWDYRRDAYRTLADRLGGIAAESYGRVFADVAASA